MTTEKENALPNSDEMKLTFEIPLFGREDEVGRLKEAYYRVKDKPLKEAVFIDGGRGMGKTALVEHVYGELDLFVKGMFTDPALPDVLTPGSAWTMALNQLCDRLSGTAPSFHLLKVNLKRYLRDDAAVLLNLIPKLKDILGDSTPPISPWSLEGIKKALVKFLRALSSQDMPVVLFIDNLQWIDELSLDLLHHVLISQDINGLLFVGCYRSNDDHLFVLNIFQRELQLKNEAQGEGAMLVRLTPIKLLDLFLPFSNALVSAAMGLEGSGSYTLTEIIHRKTKGNPFATIQILRLMHTEKMIFPDKENRRFTFDVERVNVDTVSNILDHVTNRLEEMPSTMIEVLKAVACLSPHVKREILSVVIDMEKAVIDNALNDAWEMGLLLLEGLDDEYVSFSDEALRDATLELIGNEIGSYKLKVGQALRTYLKGNQKDKWVLVKATDTLNEVIESLNKDDQIVLAHLNAESAVWALKILHFNHAVRYSEAGIGILKNFSMWKDHYACCVRLHELELQSKLRLGHKGIFQKAEDTLKNITILSNKFPFTVLQAIALLNDGKDAEAFSFASRILKESGMNFPKSATKAIIQLELMKTRTLLGKYGDDKVLGLNSAVITPMNEISAEMLKVIVDATSLTGRLDLNALAVFRLVRFCVRFGISKHLSLALASYSAILVRAGDFKGAQRYGELSVGVIDRQSMLSSPDPTVPTTLHVFLDHLSKPVYGQMDPVFGYNASVRSGDGLGAVLCANAFCLKSILSGRNLNRVAFDMEKFYGVLSQVTSTTRLWNLRLLRQFALDLLGTNNSPGHARVRILDPLAMYHNSGPVGGRAYDPIDFDAVTSKAIKESFWYTRLIYAIILQDQILLREALSWITENYESTRADYTIPVRMLMRCIAARTILDEDPNNKVNAKKMTAIIKAEFKAIEKLPKDGVKTYLYFLNGERAIMEKKNSHVVQESMNLCIYSANSVGNKMIAALANERAGLFFLTVQEMRSVGRNYMLKSLDMYRQWGAMTKVLQLIRKHDFLAASVDEATTQSSLDVLTGRFLGSVSSST